MLYIHMLKDLNLKSAEIESTQIIRELKRSVRLPVAEAEIDKITELFFASEADKEAIETAISLILPTMEGIQKIFSRNDPLYELINLKRANGVLKEAFPALVANIEYIEEINQEKNRLFTEFTQTLNLINKLKDEQEKKDHNQKLNLIFERVLRNKEFKFNFMGIVNEVHKENVSGLCKSMAEGYFFHVRLEEEIRKDRFEVIRRRVPATELEEVERISTQISKIERGVLAAYNYNLRMVELSVYLYSMVKMIMRG
ncbi:MAG: hypothetical protein ABIA37_00440 [Candidatus Woesearchaeota archaeon]